MLYKTVSIPLGSLDLDPDEAASEDERQQTLLLLKISIYLAAMILMIMKSWLSIGRLMPMYILHWRSRQSSSSAVSLSYVSIMNLICLG